MNKYTYIIIGIVLVFVGILIYQKSQNDKEKAAAQQILLTQNPNAQFTNNQGWFNLASSVLGGFAAGLGTNVGKPKEE